VKLSLVQTNMPSFHRVKYAYTGIAVAASCHVTLRDSRHKLKYYHMSKTKRDIAMPLGETEHTAQQPKLYTIGFLFILIVFYH